MKGKNAESRGSLATCLLLGATDAASGGWFCENRGGWVENISGKTRGNPTTCEIYNSFWMRENRTCLTPRLFSYQNFSIKDLIKLYKYWSKLTSLIYIKINLVLNVSNQNRSYVEWIIYNMRIEIECENSNFDVFAQLTVRKFRCIEIGGDIAEMLCKIELKDYPRNWKCNTDFMHCLYTSPVLYRFSQYRRLTLSCFFFESNIYKVV